MTDHVDDRGHLRSAKLTGFLGWGDRGRPEEDDPAEAYHEASKNVPSMLIGPTAGARALETDPRATATVNRSVKEHPHLPSVALPAPEDPEMALGEVVRQRRSRRDLEPGPMSLQDLSTVLHVGYGVTHEADTAGGKQRLRTVPSGGALYPLEIYPVVRNVEGLAPGLYHYHPFRQVLEVLREGDTAADLDRIMFSPPEVPDVPGTCAVSLFIVGVFWRSRFKYGMRGLRWVLIEAGHSGQNMLLAAESLGLGAVPWGGFWDHKVDRYLGVDGVNESVVYCVAAGQRPRG